MNVPRQLRPDHDWYPLAGALLLGGPVWHALYDGRYPFGNPEALIIPTVAAGLGWCLGHLARRLRPPLGTVIFALLLAGFGDLQFVVEDRVWFPVRLAAALGFALLLRSHRARIVTIALATFYLTAMVRPTSAPLRPPIARTDDRSPPLLVHIILDAEWGPGGFRAAGDSATANYLTDFYLSRGFSVYDGAYSRYSNTAPSLGSEFSLGRAARIESVGAVLRLGANRYFDRLEQLGYQLRVYQTSHFDYCGSPARRCRTASANALGNVGHLRARWHTRAFIATRYLLTTKTRWLRPFLGRSRSAWGWSLSGRAISTAAEVTGDIGEHGGEGIGYVVHLLIPHPPFEVDATCTAFPTLAIRDSVNLATGPARHSVPPYAAQVHCAHQFLDRLLATVDRVAGPGRSIVIVQGDHGPRLGVTSRMTLASFGPKQVNSAFATLFAIRTPYSSAQVVTGAVPIQDLFASFVAHDFARADSGPWQRFVVGPPSRPGGSDTLRLLTAAETIWSPPPSADSLTKPHPAYQHSGIR